MESPVSPSSASDPAPSESDADLAWPADEPTDTPAAPPPDLPPEERPADGPKVAFADMKLITPLADAIRHAGYEFATPVQASVIPKAMKGADVIGQAQTGTGKTAAFLIPFLNRWRPHKLKGPVGLIMCPTRELALQVATEAEKLAPSSRFHTVAVYGGARMGKQIEGLTRGCDLVVGTPGRMLDHLRRGNMSLADVRYVVLDEADRMLDIGFRPDIERILRNCPSERQTLLMSATVPDAIKRLVNRYMINPLHLNLSPGVLTVDKIRQAYITVDDDRKFDLLVKVLQREKPRQCLIFVERKRSADKLYDRLRGHFKGVSVIHGDLPQSHREKIMAGFRADKVHVLIATDVASRGIDVTGISHVINFDLPTDLENYVHRIGRTGRIGRDGVAISFATPEQGGVLTDIEMTINRLIEEDRIEGFEAYTPRKRYDTPRAAPTPGEGDQQPADTPPPPEKKQVFGKYSRKYSSRL